MSMLAEPRRKQKWSVDPRNSSWSKDESKFGQKMLERMGWSKGKGLGRTQQGSTEHIKVKVKNNNYGLGANASHEDNWIAHQDDFNELLSQLNNHHGQTVSSEVLPEEKKGFSLEEKSKTSKKRVHYMKFTKGKDLSSRSEKDLNCIFGKRARLDKDQEQESNSHSDSQGETEENGTSSPPELDAEPITKTVTSTLTMQEYFAQRMAQLKKNRETESAVIPADTQASEKEGLSPVHRRSEKDECKKKKKKRKETDEETEECEGEEESNQKQASTKKNTEEEEGEDTQSPTRVIDSEQQSLSKKKKSKKNKRRKSLNNPDIEVEETQTNHQKELDIAVTGNEEQVEEKKPKKKKRKRQAQD